MNTIQDRFSHIKEEIKQAALAAGRAPEDIVLVSVSKKKSTDTIVKGIDAGIDVLGENYIQEAMDKIDTIGRDAAQWHFIGHLQSNKARFAVKYFDSIHTVDKLKLAKEIDKQARKIGKTQNILLQINISEERSKSGASAKDALELAEKISRLDHVALKGLMCIPPFFDTPEKARPYFKALAEIKTIIAQKKIPGIFMDHLSMGMSNDFKVAIKEGATMVRIGTAIFGVRA
ncbi:MAG: YggS family pyridoxal phosphate-dependent enzyme [Thermodesulfobacteriota bacterium]|nr:YggS family pyridoxal phosphate-dependent enzyme [Thermodesulfobacteriota bacterium]